MNIRMIHFPSIRLHISSMFDFKRRKAAVKEPETVAWLRKCLERYGSFTLVDIGANVGGYSLIGCALDPLCRAVAIEPFPPTYLTLCRNIAINSLADRIVPVNALVGTAADPTISLNFNHWTSGVAEHLTEGRYRLQIPTIGSEGLLPHLSDAASIILKIDVDGGEINVMAALHGLLLDVRLHSLLIECDADTRGPIEHILAETKFQVASSHGKLNLRQVNLIAHRETLA